MKPLSDDAVDRLRHISDWPDLEGSRYQVLERIAQGGMGTVYKARDLLFDRLVALKVLNAALRSSEGVERLAREARILAALDHPGIIPVHDLGRLGDGRVYYVMKLVEGTRLDQLVRRFAAPPPAARDRSGLSEVLQVFLKICDAVAFAHAKGIVHRDLKPQNIMIGSFGEVLVLDWGVAGFLDETVLDSAAPGNSRPSAPTLTVGGTVMGTPGYMPPEQATGKVQLINERSDVFALGAILDFLLSSIQTNPEQPRRSGKNQPRALLAVCRKAMADNQADRYPNVAALADDIQRFLAGARVRAHQETTWDAVVRLVSKYRTPLLLILAYLIMRILLIIFARA